jgi:hypothetical protein
MYFRGKVTQKNWFLLKVLSKINSVYKKNMNKYSNFQRKLINMIYEEKKLEFGMFFTAEFFSFGLRRSRRRRRR